MNPFDPLNYFVYPYTEIDGKTHSETAYEVAYRDAGSQPAVSVHG
jgi:hypothetical protein